MASITDRIIKIKKDSTNTEIGTIDLLNLQAGLRGARGYFGDVYKTTPEEAVYLEGVTNCIILTALPDATTMNYGEEIMLAPSGDIYLREQDPARWVLRGRILIG